jgi:O-acetylserine/cysteine efflux transporter
MPEPPGAIDHPGRAGAAVRVRSLAAMLLLAVMWGLSIPVTKLGLLALPPLTLTALRFAVAVPVLLLFAAGPRRLPWRALPRVATLGALANGVGQVAQAYGVAGTSASVGTISRRPFRSSSCCLRRCA